MVNSPHVALLKHFFGEKLNKTLSFAEFASYLEGLQREVLKREISTRPFFVLCSLYVCVLFSVCCVHFPL